MEARGTETGFLTGKAEDIEACATRWLADRFLVGTVTREDAVRLAREECTRTGRAFVVSIGG